MHVHTPNLPATVFRAADLVENYRAVRRRLHGAPPARPTIERALPRPVSAVMMAVPARPIGALAPIVVAKTFEGRLLAAIGQFERLSIDLPHIRASVRARMAVARAWNMAAVDIISPRRFTSLVEPRQAGMAIARHIGMVSLPQIGRDFGDRDHSTAHHAARKYEVKINGLVIWRAMFMPMLPALPKPEWF